MPGATHDATNVDDLALGITAITVTAITAINTLVNQINTESGARADQ